MADFIICQPTSVLCHRFVQPITELREIKLFHCKARNIKCQKYCRLKTFYAKYKLSPELEASFGDAKKTRHLISQLRRDEVAAQRIFAAGRCENANGAKSRSFLRVMF